MVIIPYQDNSYMRPHLCVQLGHLCVSNKDTHSLGRGAGCGGIIYVYSPPTLPPVPPALWGEAHLHFHVLSFGT